MTGGLLGCDAFREAQPDDPRYAPPPPVTMAAPQNATGAIYQAGYSNPLFEDRKARRVGDILTIVLIERTQAIKQANTRTAKATDVNIANPTILGSSPQFNTPGLFPLASNQNNTLATTLSSENEFEGRSMSDQQNNLTGTISVSVANVLPNGYLVVRGEKWVTLNTGDEFIRVSGIVRPEDIDSNNEVDSNKVANARITYSGKGEVADSNKMGWLAKFFGSILSPF